MRLFSFYVQISLSEVDKYSTFFFLDVRTGCADCPKRRLDGFSVQLSSAGADESPIRRVR